MKFAIGYAGIPTAIFDDVRKNDREFAEGARVFAKPLRSNHYDEEQADYLVKSFARLVSSDDHSVERDTGFCVVYIVKDFASTTAFRERLFPFTLLVPVEWSLSNGPLKNVLNSKNDLVRRLRQASLAARETLRALRAEINERAGHTPLLLPVKNFRSAHLQVELETLPGRLLAARNREEALRQQLREFVRRHPPQKIGARHRACFVDDRHVEFHPPGSARHGFARRSAEHPDECLLAGTRRLGAPYDHAFHYDCCRGDANLRDQFSYCHGADLQAFQGKPHLNISPNDHVRA